jgi:hypothetical protein
MFKLRSSLIRFPIGVLDIQFWVVVRVCGHADDALSTHVMAKTLKINWVFSWVAGFRRREMQKPKPSPRTWSNRGEIPSGS